MGIFDRFPYSSTHEMNLDFMLGKATEIAESLQEVQDGLSDIDTHKAQAEQAAQAAQASQAAASASAGQAAQHKTDAEDAADRAETASTEAETAADRAETALGNITNAETVCTEAAEEAQQYAEASQTHSGQAQIYKNAAEAAKNSAELNAYQAATSAGSAANSATDAASSASSANVSATNANLHASNAETSATNAATSATNAATSATNAAASANDIQEAADHVESLVESLPEDFTDLNNTVNQLSDEIVDLKSAVGDYANTNNARFVFSENLFDSAMAVNGYYVNNTNGNLIAYSGWFTTPFMPVDDSVDYSFIIRESGDNWKKPSGVYYAFYDSGYTYTHGGVSSAGGNLATQNGDAYCRASYYSGAIYTSMFGTATDMEDYVGTKAAVIPYYIAPKYDSDPYKGLICAFSGIANPYYSLRVAGNRITTTQNGDIHGAFIKFDTIVMVAEDGFKTKSWTDFKTDIQNDAYIEIASAYDGTPDTLRVLPEYGIIYNYKTNTYHVKNKVYMTSLTKHDIVVFYIDANSVPSGVLYDAWVGNHKQGIEKYIRTIENRETGLLNYGSNFVFAFATDCHWYFDDTAYHNYTNEMIEELRKCIGFDCYINGGDSIYYGTKYKLNGVASLRKAFEPEHDDYIYCIGNHDYNGISTGETQNSDWMFSADGIESLCMRKMQNIVRPAGARYYYRDFEYKKIRVIVLDTSDLDITFDGNGNLTSADPLTKFVVRQDQIDWFCNALDCPDSSWGVVIVMHVGLYLAEDGFTDNNPLTNRQAIIDILKAYLNKGAYAYSTTGTYAVSGSGTFANAKGSLVGVWSGHAHADGYCNKDGFNAIQTECGYPDSASRAVGTIDEICVDCVCVDMTNKTITLKRFGPGSDREYSFN